LPDVAPLEFRCGIAMRPDMVGPGQSDGVTFSAYLDERELFRQHQDQGAWRDYTFDLAAYRGQIITLRLQCEPGPANSPSFDYSYWGDAKIIAGQDEDSTASQLQAITASRAYRAVDQVDLRKAANRSGGGIEPSSLLDAPTSLKAEGDAWVLSCLGADATVVYRYTPATGTLDDWTVQVNGGPLMRPMAGGGVVPVGAEQVVRADARVTLTGAPAQGTLAAVWRYPSAQGPVDVTWRFRLAGKALVVEAEAAQPRLARLTLGGLAGAPLRRTIAIPYLPADWSPGTLLWLPSEQVYVNRYLDWTRSHGSRCPQSTVPYEPPTTGRLNPLYETGYVAVSPALPEVLPNIPWPASKYLSLLGPRSCSTSGGTSRAGWPATRS